MPPSVPAAMSRDMFISAMRQVASAVTVVTTDGAEGRHGATVSAFASVSADPPTILVCLNAASGIARAVQANARFCVNILPEDRAEIADRFAGRHDATVGDRFDGIETEDRPGLAPRIDCALGLCARVEQTLLSGSHLIVIGAVQDITGDIVRPLTYRDGVYHRVVPHGPSDALPRELRTR